MKHFPHFLNYGFCGFTNTLLILALTSWYATTYENLIEYSNQNGAILNMVGLI